jgi:hypothetical protein
VSPCCRDFRRLRYQIAKATRAMITRPTSAEGTAMAAMMPGDKDWEDEDGNDEGSGRGESEREAGADVDRAKEPRPG